MATSLAMQIWDQPKTDEHKLLEHHRLTLPSHRPWIIPRGEVQHLGLYLSYRLVFHNRYETKVFFLMAVNADDE